MEAPFEGQAQLDMSTPIKFLRADGSGPYSGFAWPLPTADAPGAWVEVAGELVPCSVGLHFTTLRHWREWANARLFVLETDGIVLGEGSKQVCGRARLTREIVTWNSTTLRLFAADCAERVLPRFEREYPHDSRPRTAIDTARRFARGLATRDELAAAWDTAGAAARDAAGDAAWAAARVAAGDAARDTAWNTAWAAARAAARDAVWAAVEAAEVSWQDDVLLDYLTGGRE